jgi:hypothetical protein
MRRLVARRTARTRDDRGVALFAAIAAMVVLSTMIAALVILARNEGLIAQLNKDEAQAAYAAEAGANWGRFLLHQRLRMDLPKAVAAAPKDTLRAALNSTYSVATGGAQFIRDYAIPASGPTFTACSPCPDPKYSVVGDPTTKQIADNLQSLLTITCPGMAGCPANTAFTTRVIVSSHPDQPPDVRDQGHRVLFTYVWRIESSGTAGRARQQWVIHDSAVPNPPYDGTFTIALNDQFVKYAHFIDQFQDAGSGAPWMSFRHKYTGPVHTNRRFSILGNTSTPGEEGPIFRSEATQTMTTTRFNNGGNEQNLSRDSSPRDWPRLGPAPGILCKQVDCSGFTRGFDYNPATPTPNPIPFPGGSNPPDRLAQACLARQSAVNPITNCTGAANFSGLPPVCRGTTSAGVLVDLEVVVSNNCTAGAALILNGGIWVKGNVTDLLLGNIENQGQSIVIYASSDATPRRTVITESRTPSKTTTIQRQCRKLISTPGALCDNGGTFWNLDPDRLPNNQTFSNVFSPDPATDYGLIFVTGNIGSSGTLNGLRRGISVNTTSGVGDTAYAIYQNTGLTTANKEDGTRLTVVADGNIFITGQLNYRIDPRGSDGEFSEPIPGDGDDQLDVQNVLGIFSWGLGMAGGVQLSSALTGNVDTHGLIFAANASGNAGPSGQFSFEDPDGSPRGESRVLGGVVQKTMGQFGQPSSNSGYERNWFYDERFRYRAVSPPKLPLVESFTAATTLGIDSYTWRLGLFN